MTVKVTPEMDGREERARPKDIPKEIKAGVWVKLWKEKSCSKFRRMERKSYGPRMCDAMQ